jgi:hypothetical protein
MADKTVTPPALASNGVVKPATLTCHRFFAPVVFPEPDPMVPNRVNINPRLGNFPCIKDKCSLWNPVDSECYDVTTAKSHKTMAEYAFNKMNDVHIQDGGA